MLIVLLSVSVVVSGCVVIMKARDEMEAISAVDTCAEGRRVYMICAPGDMGQSMHPGPGEEWYYFCEDLGEYGIDWVRCVRGGTEGRRWNVRYLERVEFEEGETFQKPHGKLCADWPI